MIVVIHHKGVFKLQIKLSESKIIDRCGMEASIRGERYYKGNKVKIHRDDPDRCDATVVGKEDFHIEIHHTGQVIQTSCTCPKLLSYAKECQHVAAVLHAILHKQKRTASNDLLQIFKDDYTRSFVAQSYFETRSEVRIAYICNMLTHQSENVLTLKIKINDKTIDSIPHFLKTLQEDGKYKQNGLLIFDMDFHCIAQEKASVLECLLQMVQDKTYDEFEDTLENNALIIPPSLWNIIFPLLNHENFAFLEKNNGALLPIREAKSVLPLQFTVGGMDGKAQLEINGLEQLIMLTNYKMALYDGKFYRLTKDAAKRLLELQSVLKEYNVISLSEEQLVFFSEKVIPKLREIGKVEIAKEIMNQFDHPPLKAKLYLDKVNDRLLGSLEFHYDYFIINPSEEVEGEVESLTIRDIDREEIILGLMNEANFYKTDGGYILHNEELEYEFLNHILPNLEEHVQVYATTAVRNRILKQPVKPKIRIRHQKERVDWLAFKFEMEGFPEKEIKEILEALQEKRKYYRVQSGSLLSLETKEFAEIQEFLMQAPFLDNDLQDNFEVPIIKGLKMIDQFTSDSVITAEESFQNFLQTISHPETENIEVPGNVHATLRDYQITGYKWMKSLNQYGFSGVLADDMGLGKTLQSITYIASNMQEMRENDLQTLIVCPSSVMYHWQKELKKFAPELTVEIIDGNKEKRLKRLSHIRKLDVVITSYSMVRADIEWYKKRAFHTVIFDEAQAFKNPRTQTARAVKKLQAKHRFALTGTPMENTIEELWAIFYVVFPELFGSLKDYSELSNEKISRRIRPFMLRRMKKDVAIELPEKQEILELVELNPEQKKVYAAYLAKLRQESLKHLDQETLRKNRIRILAGLTRLRQICCHPALFVEGYKGDSAKFTKLMSIIEVSQLANRRILIFSQFTNMLQIIARELAKQGISFFYLDGATPPEERETMSGRFNQGERDIFLISLKAGGTGLNLTGADTVILYDLWWNPAVEEQAADRAYRIGQKNDVQVIKLLAKGTIEEKMNQLQERKRNLIKEIIEPTGQVSTTLTVEDIKELLDVE